MAINATLALWIRMGDTVGKVSLFGYPEQNRDTNTKDHFRMAKGGVPATDEGWILCGVSTRADFMLSGLDVMQEYVFCVAALTPEGLSDYSAPIYKIVV